MEACSTCAPQDPISGKRTESLGSTLNFDLPQEGHRGGPERLRLRWTEIRPRPRVAITVDANRN